MATFELNKQYGNGLTITVLKRTAKTITIETAVWGVQRVKIREYQEGVESIHYKAWIITANELFDAEEAKRISYENAYYS